MTWLIENHGVATSSQADGDTGRPDRPFPESLCHRCAAPPRYVTSDRGSLFIYCPVLKRYPPQPVTACEAFVEKA